MPTISHLLATALGLLLYHSVVTLGAAFFATWFRRHLMLFKLWTPRYMLAAVELTTLHVGLVMAVVGAGIVASKVGLTFGSAFE
jgi:phosphatidylinositol glycan class O